MIYSIIVRPSALRDLRSAVDYYNIQRAGLGDRMALEVDIMLNKIASNPHTFSARYRNIRAAKLKSFPFLIFYSTQEENKSVVVLRIFHTSQRPLWRH